MKRLLNIEWLKTIHYRTTKLFLLAYVAIVVLGTITLTQDIPFLGLNINLDDLGVFQTPQIWHFMTFAFAILKIFLAIIVVTNISNEFSYGTLKQNLIDGLSKKEFVLSKTLTIVLMSAAATLLVFFISLLLGLQKSTEFVFMSTDLWYVLSFFVKHLAFLSFAMLLCIWVRKSALSLALLFIWWIIESIIRTMEFFTYKSLDMKSISKDYYLSDFLPLRAMEQTIPNPATRVNQVQEMTQGMLPPVVLEPIFLVVSFAYFILFVGLSYWLVKRRDL
ncbi:MAG: ABC transporter permease [Weeksellaceae bacterium]|nr:ABC transporter permease [Weeksellaceae bacterium]